VKITDGHFLASWGNIIGKLSYSLTQIQSDTIRFVLFNAVMICVFGAPQNGPDYLTVIIVAAPGELLLMS